MRYDIVIISYNSERWLPGCIRALAKLEYDLSQLNVIVVDNASAQPCVQLLRRLKEEYTCFGGFVLEESPVNLGFGRGCNRGATLGTAPYIFLLNADTEICPDALTELDKSIAEKGDAAGSFELRQKPWEFCQHHDPVTQEVEWNSGACVVYPRPVFELVEGFDENIFLYCEDVDLSWRIRAYGYRLYYVPRASAYHYTLTRKPAGEKIFREYLWNCYTKLMLHYKYGGFRQRYAGIVEYLYTIRYPQAYPGVRRELLKKFLRHFIEIPKYTAWRRKNREIAEHVPVNWVPGFTTMRGRYTYKPLKAQPLVSVCIRTGEDMAALRDTLCSLRNQTYRRFEILLQQDGPDTMERGLLTEFSDLCLGFEACGETVGRAGAGNRALARAKGGYVLLADAGDLFYAEHLEMMVSVFQSYPDAQMVYSGYVRYEGSRDGAKSYEPPAKLTLPQFCSRNAIPLCSMVFKRELYQKADGLQENAEENEAWAMWLRFLAAGARMYSSPRATVLLRMPEDPQTRGYLFEAGRADVLKDPALVWKLSAEELSELERGTPEAMIAKELSIYDEWPQELMDL